MQSTFFIKLEFLIKNLKITYFIDHIYTNDIKFKKI